MLGREEPAYVATRTWKVIQRDHDGALLLGPLKCRWTTWFTKYGGPTERKWSKQTGRVTTCETPGVSGVLWTWEEFLPVTG